MSRSSRSVAVIGAGVAGLVVALRRAARGDDVTVFEASPRCGGQLHTERAQGFIVEHGAEGFVAGSEAVHRVASELGIRGDIQDQLVTDSCRFDGTTLLRLDPGEAGRMLGFQVEARALGKGIQSFRAGMAQLAEALVAALHGRARCATEAAVRRLDANPAGWHLEVAGTSAAFDRVVVATSAAAAADLLEPTFGARAAELRQSRALSNVNVTLAFDRSRVGHALDATGFVVADTAQQEGFRACTFASSKFAGRAAPERALLRLFFRPTERDLVLPDGEWVARAERCARRVLSLDGGPSASWVSRWPHALPVFDAAHRERVAALEAALRGSGVSLAGAAFHGSGIDGAVRSAEAAAAALDG